MPHYGHQSSSIASAQSCNSQSRARQRVLQMEILHYILFCLIFYLILPLKCHLVRLQTKLTKGSHTFLSWECLLNLQFERDYDMVTPFLNARNFIFQAQNKTDLEEQKLLLQKAFDQLTTATNAVYTDLKTSAEHLAKLTIRSFFRNMQIMFKRNASSATAERLFHF